MLQVTSPAGGLCCPLWAAKGQIPHEAWDLIVPSLPYLGWELMGEGARQHDGGTTGTSCTVTKPGFRKLRLEMPRSGCAP